MKHAWLISRNADRRAFLSAAAAALLLFSGCATSVRVEEDALARAAVTALPADREAYFFIDARSARAFLDHAAVSLGGGSGRIAGILERIEYIYAATGTDPETAVWTIIGTGSFPVSSYALGLDFSRAWKRATGPGRRWISSGSGIEIALSGPQIVVIGSKDIDLTVARLSAPGVPGASVGNIFFRELLGKPHPGVVAYLLELGALLPSELRAGMIDGFTVVIMGDFIDDALRAEMVFNFQSPLHARVAGLAIRTLILAESRKEKDRMFTEARVTVNGEIVNVSPVVIGSDRIIEYLETALAGGGGAQ